MSAGLERRYRWLLLAFPRAYREHRGVEMLTTYLDLAAAGGGRLGRRESAHLILCGLRQRFRLPARRPLAWVGALLAAVVLGAFGAAAGTWTGWQTATAIPADGNLRDLNAAASGITAPTLVAVYPDDSSAIQGPSALARTFGPSDYSAERIRAALTADGWRITSFRDEAGATMAFPSDTAVDMVSIPTTFVYYTAVKDGLKLSGSGDVVTGTELGLAGQTSFGTMVWPVEAAAVRPLTLAGALAGALAGWLLAAAFARRMRADDRRRRWSATVLCAAGFAAVAVPAYRLYWDAYQVLAYAHGSPEPYVVYSPTISFPIPAYAALGLLAALAVAAGIRRRPPHREPAPSVAR
ncbi:hypothetical protein [Actinoplanes awajinensis]|uniref:Uncharacterized protein n=1 Tax=Actinoplanes awajinensis subsp. mycoplanecinus TaxID=135947 RepID=A0A117MQ37_9ACTN|nr:hypothetical protein [Actinoplanes awajinensis]KUL29620.1 hypothetical protein ADL15_27280 [Actinoplanes awajinensis subsp. mycoplanecinus]